MTAAHHASPWDATTRGYLRKTGTTGTQSRDTPRDTYTGSVPGAKLVNLHISNVGLKGSIGGDS